MACRSRRVWGPAQETWVTWNPQARMGGRGRSVFCLVKGDPHTHIPPQEQWDFPDLEATLPLLFVRLQAAALFCFIFIFFSNRSTLSIRPRQPRETGHCSPGEPVPAVLLLPLSPVSVDLAREQVQPGR